MAHALANRRAGDIHRGVARADDIQAVTEAVAVRIVKVIDGKMDIAQRFALDMQGIGLPNARADENRPIAVAEQVINADCRADGRIRANLNALEDEMMILEIIQNGLGQTEIRNAIAQNAANLILALENGHLIALARKHNGNRQTRRSGADNRHADAVGRRGTLDHLIAVRRGNVAFNRGKMNGCALSSEHAMPLALILMVAHQRANRRQRVVFKEHPARLVELAVQHQPDDLRNWRMNGTPLLALGDFAVQAALCLFQNMNSHKIYYLSVSLSIR